LFVTGKKPTVEESRRIDPSHRRTTLIVSLLLAAVTFAVYSSARSNSFLTFDDDIYVTNNLHVRAGLNWTTLSWAFTSTEAENWHPLTWLSHALDCQLYGLNPASHHLTSVLLHVVDSVLLFLLLLWTTGAMWRSLLVAALFALHPFNVESVVWIAERKNVLSTLVLLLAMGAYAWYAQLPSVRRYLVVAGLFMAGLAAKPMVITLPFVLLLLDVWPLQRVRGQAPSSPVKNRKKVPQPIDAGPKNRSPFRVPRFPFSRLVLEKLPLLPFCAASAVITVIAQRANGIQSFQRFPLGVRLDNAVYSYAMYVWKAFWPVRLAAYYPHPGDTLSPWQLGLATLFLAAVSMLVWTQRSSRGYLVTGWLWYLITLVPVIGLVQVGNQAMADRYAYVPLVGIFIMLVWGAADIADRIQLGVPWRMAASAVVLAVLSFLTWRQVRYWRSDYDLWSHTVQVTGDNLIAEEFLSKALVIEGRDEEALPGLEKAAEFSPDDPMRHIHLAGVLANVGRYQDAIAEYQKAIQTISGLRIHPKWKDAATRSVQVRCYESMAISYGELGDFTHARESFRQALNADPPQASKMVARMTDYAADSPSGARYFMLAVLLQETGKLPEAHAAFEQAVELDPSLKASGQF
jgi:protein O-mannosyl-transferase